MSSNAYRKQHIVPVTYLDNFADNGQIGVIQNDSKHYTQNIHNVGYIKNFYDTPLRENGKYWENYFAENIEPKYRVLANLAVKATLSNSTSNIFSDEEKREISVIVITQWLRTPDFLKEAANRIDRHNVVGKYISNELPFITSDNPVIALNSYLHTTEKKYNGLGK